LPTARLRFRDHETKSIRGLGKLQCGDGRATQILRRPSKMMTRFRRQTGEPGPAAWAGGRYPVGEGEFPARVLTPHRTIRLER
jgi:hypothetical protein